MQQQMGNEKLQSSSRSVGKAHLFHIRMFCVTLNVHEVLLYACLYVMSNFYYSLVA